jgi:peptide/nickel transport system substrate-binding protein
MLNFAQKPLVASLLACWLLTAGCSFTTSSAGPTNKTLVVNHSFDFYCCDPPQGLGLAIPQLYETLVRSNPDGALEPLLAQSFVASPDGLSVTFKLRHDVHFSDGTPMTSADVVFSLMRVKYLNGVASTSMTGLTASAPDQYTVVVTSEAPNLFITSQMSNAGNGILNSKVVQANGGNDSPDAAKADAATAFLNQKSVGSGPYVLDSLEANVQIVLKSNPTYWGSSKPSYSKVVLRNEAASAQLLDVQQGQNVLAMDLSPQQAATVDKSKVNVISRPSLHVLTLMLNASHAVSPATSNLQFRQAVRYAIDYKALVALGGLGTVQASGMLPIGIPGSLPPNQVTTRDVAKAKTLLAQSGVADPTFALTYASDVSVPGASTGDLAQLIQANLKDAGINMVLDPEANVTLRPKWFGGKLQAYLYPLGPEAFDASSASDTAANGHISKWMGWTTGLDPTSDALAAQMLGNTDPSKEAGLITPEQAATDEFAVFIPILISPYELVASRSVGGLNLNPLDVVIFAALA